MVEKMQETQTPSREILESFSRRKFFVYLKTILFLGVIEGEFLFKLSDGQQSVFHLSKGMPLTKELPQNYDRVDIYH